MDAQLLFDLGTEDLHPFYARVRELNLPDVWTRFVNTEKRRVWIKGERENMDKLQASFPQLPRRAFEGAEGNLWGFYQASEPSETVPPDDCTAATQWQSGKKVLLWQKYLAYSSSGFNLDESVKKGESFLLEALKYMRVRHPRLLQVCDAAYCLSESVNILIILEYVSAKTLTQILQERHSLSSSYALRTALAVADALECLWAAKTGHRFLFPGAVLFDLEKHAVKLAPLYLFCFVENMQGTHYSQGIASEFFPYCSREALLQDFGKTGETCDIYSLGAILYHMVTGCLPYEADSTGNVLGKILGGCPPALVLEKAPYLDPRIAAVICKALHEGPQKRFASIAKMAAAIRSLIPGY